MMESTSRSRQQKMPANLEELEYGVSITELSGLGPQKSAAGYAALASRIS